MPNWTAKSALMTDITTGTVAKMVEIIMSAMDWNAFTSSPVMSTELPVPASDAKASTASSQEKSAVSNRSRAAPGNAFLSFFMGVTSFIGLYF